MPYTLAYKDRFVRAFSPITDTGDDCESVIPFPYLEQDAPNLIRYEWTGAQVTRLFSALKTGADLMFPEVANDILWDFLKGLSCPPPFPDEEDGCINYLPYAPFVSFSPQNPYNQPDYVPPDYEAVPFKVNSDLEYPEYFGYQATDVMVNSAAFSIDPIVIATLDFPQFVIRVVGSGQIEIDLLTIQSGGLLVYKVGEPPNILDIFEEETVGDDIVIVDLNNDSVSVPPESDIVSAQEINIDAASGVVTLVYFVFLPVLDDSLIPLRFGGGIRQIGLCGFEAEADGMGIEDVRFNTENCTFEKRVLGEWEAIEGGDEWLMCVDGGGMSITKQEVREAVVEAAQDVSQFILQGALAVPSKDVKIGYDGVVDISSPGQEPDDTSTTADEEARSGGAQAVYLGFKNLILDLHSWITLGLSSADIYTRMRSKYNVEASMEAAITAYKTDFLAPPASWTTPVITVALASKIYCKGNSIGTIADYIISLWDAEVNDLLGIANGLSQSQLDAWFNSGKVVPSTDYLGYSCVKIAPFELVIAANPQTLVDTHPMKKYHRYEVIIEGYWTDAAGRVQDAWWTKDVGVSENFSTSLLTMNAYLATKTYPTSFEAPYDPINHRYKWTLDCGSVDLSITFVVSKWGSFVGAISSPTGGFTISIRDLGEIL